MSRGLPVSSVVILLSESLSPLFLGLPSTVFLLVLDTLLLCFKFTLSENITVSATSANAVPTEAAQGDHYGYEGGHLTRLTLCDTLFILKLAGFVFLFRVLEASVRIPICITVSAE